MADLIVTVVLLAAYLVLWLAPEQKFHRRPAMNTFARFNAASLLGAVVAISIRLASSDDRYASCMVETFSAVLDILVPIIIFRTVHLDCLFWQVSDG